MAKLRVNAGRNDTVCALSEGTAKNHMDKEYGCIIYYKGGAESWEQ